MNRLHFKGDEVYQVELDTPLHARKLDHTLLARFYKTKSGAWRWQVLSAEAPECRRGYCHQGAAAMGFSRRYNHGKPKLSIWDTWTPTPDNINSLPVRLRRYVADIETMCDPTGLVRDNHLLREQLLGLTRMYNELKEERNERR